MSLLPTATYAGATEEFWAQAGSAGSPAGVTKILAGTNVTIFPTDGVGEVTINAAGGGGGGVTSVTASGPGIGASPTTGAVILTNTGVTSVAAGTGMSVSAPTGALTVTNSGVTSLVAGPGIAVSAGTGAVTVSTSGFPVFPTLQTFTYVGNGIPLTYSVTSNAFRILFDDAAGTNALFNSGAGLGFINNGRITLSNPAWNDTTIVMAMVGGPPSAPGGGVSQRYFGGIATCGGTGTNRVFTISGDSDVAPSQLNVFGFNGDKYVYFLVFQTAP